MPKLIGLSNLEITQRQSIEGGLWVEGYPYLEGENVCDPFGQVYIINNGVLASKINVLSFGNENWTDAYIALVYPDYYCIKV
jgi:hypothetical protein